MIKYIFISLSYEVHIVVVTATNICLPHAGMLWIFNWF